jgi:hypothetical protein
MRYTELDVHDFKMSMWAFAIMALLFSFNSAGWLSWVTGAATALFALAGLFSERLLKKAVSVG